jgi:hypothetical protein
MAETVAVAEVVAAFCAASFAGAAVYISLVEHPARMACGVELAATEFVPSYRRAAVMQASLAALGLACALLAWLAGAGRLWLAGGVLLGAVIPFTLVVILPTNRQLLDPALDRRSERTRRLLDRWGRLHAVRSALGVAAAVLLLVALRAR